MAEEQARRVVESWSETATVAGEGDGIDASVAERRQNDARERRRPNGAGGERRRTVSLFKTVLLHLI